MARGRGGTGNHVDVPDLAMGSETMMREELGIEKMALVAVEENFRALQKQLI